jgi:hypothetical protein
VYPGGFGHISALRDAGWRRKARHLGPAVEDMEAASDELIERHAIHNGWRSDIGGGDCKSGDGGCKGGPVRTITRF